MFSDGTTETAPITVSITVNEVNDPPVTAADAYTTDEDVALVVDAADGVLANDTDAEGDDLAVTLVGAARRTAPSRWKPTARSPTRLARTTTERTPSPTRRRTARTRRRQRP